MSRSQHARKEHARRLAKEARKRRKVQGVDHAAIVVPVPLKRTNRVRDQVDVQTDRL